MTISSGAGTVINSLGPFQGALGLPVNTKPALGQGIFNNTVGAAGTLVLSNSSNGAKRRIKIVNPLAGRNLAWTVITRGQTAPAGMTAVGDGTATDGSLIQGGGGSTEWIALNAEHDLYLAASAAATPYQLTVVEYQ